MVVPGRYVLSPDLDVPGALLSVSERGSDSPVESESKPWVLETPRLACDSSSAARDMLVKLHKKSISCRN